MNAPTRALRMDWLPPLPEFRAALRAAMEAPARERIERLAGLAGHRLGMLEVQQLDRALLQSDAAAASGFTRVRLAVIGSATLHQLAPGIRVAGLRHRVLFEVHTGGYAQFRNEALDPASELHRFRPAVVLMSSTAHDLLGEVPLGAGRAEADAALERALDDLRAVWRALSGRLEAMVIQQTVLDTSPPFFGSFERSVPAAPAHLVACLNERIGAAAAEAGVSLLDLAGRAQRDGLDAWFDLRYWLQAKQEISIEAAPMYGELLARVVAAQQGRSRKALVLDLDNTLWGGVVGDVGLEGIALGAGSAEGEAHLALQRYAKRLAERGIVLAVCSKNETETAEAVFREHPEMLLRRADIAAFVANWNDKAENIRQIARTLNLGLDSLVFVDDNAAERARVREALPMVAVPELPEDPAHYVGTLAAGGYFEAVAFTREDRERATFYASDAERVALRGEAGSLEDFLAGLAMRVIHGPFAKNDLARVTQLVNKTNQFNTTTRRYSADEIAARAAAPEFLTLQFRLADRLGDNGIVSTMILAPVPGAPAALDIENWVMSCRVFGRELEFEAMNIAVAAAAGRAVRTLFADFVPTAKNGVIEELFFKLGFRLCDGVVGQRSRWRLDLTEYLPRQTRIARETMP